MQALKACPFRGQNLALCLWLQGELDTSCYPFIKIAGSSSCFHPEDAFFPAYLACVRRDIPVVLHRQFSGQIDKPRGAKSVQQMQTAVPCAICIPPTPSSSSLAQHASQLSCADNGRVLIVNAECEQDGAVQVAQQHLRIRSLVGVDE